MLERHLAGRIAHERKPGGLPFVPNVMPVRMRVAEFIPDGNGGLKRNTDYNSVDQLDPSKPVWVVVHGRNDKDESGKMIELEKELTQNGYQVVSIDWREAAQSITVDGEAWIQAVGDWSYQALVAAGIQGEMIRMGVHSWGSLVGYEIAEHFKVVNGFGVDSIVALDPAIDPSLSMYYDASQVNFASVSKASTAFWSSAWGSAGRAQTAHRTIELRTEAAVDPEIIANQTLKHSMAVTTFANLLKLKRIDPTNQIAAKFSWSSNELSGIPASAGIDAWMSVDPFREVGAESSDKYIDAIPLSMTFTNPDDTSEDLYFINERGYLE